MLNLIDEAWIEVERRSGATQRIRPAQLVEGLENDPIVSFATLRSDFAGALIQFFIGLSQTAMMPPNSEAWEDKLYEPPSVEDLDAAFKVIAPAFNVDGDGPRFMQDFDSFEGEEQPVERLLIGGPGEQTLKHNKDHFIKRNSDAWLSWESAALALFTLQINASGGGPGYRTSIRGGGPITTLVEGASLWDTVWLNTLSREEFYRGHEKSTDDLLTPQVFPWLGKTRTSEKGGLETTPLDVDRLTVFWNMPWRIRFDIKETTEQACLVTGEDLERGISGFVKTNYGTNYTGPWKHPLTPYTETKDGVPNPMKGSPDGIGYQHWVGCIGKGSQAKFARQPAQAVMQCLSSAALREYRKEKEQAQNIKVSVFGYDMESAKTREWIASSLEGYLLPHEHSDLLVQRAESLIVVAKEIMTTVRRSVLRALFGRPKTAGKKTEWHVGVKSDSTLSSDVYNRYWQGSNLHFYSALERIIEMLTKNNMTEWEVIATDYLTMLHKHGLEIFDDLTMPISYQSADPKTLVLARRELSLETMPGNKKMRKKLDLGTKA